MNTVNVLSPVLYLCFPPKTIWFSSIHNILDAIQEDVVKGSQQRRLYLKSHDPYSYSKDLVKLILYTASLKQTIMLSPRKCSYLLKWISWLKSMYMSVTEMKSQLIGQLQELEFHYLNSLKLLYFFILVNIKMSVILIHV